MNRLQSRIQLKIWGEKSVILLTRLKQQMLSECYRCEQCRKTLCFIAHAKAFNKVWQRSIWTARKTYSEQIICIWRENNLNNYTKTENSLRRGWIFSPDLFNLYSEVIFGELEDLPEFIIDGCNLNCTRYEDNTVLMTYSEKNCKNS